MKIMLLALAAVSAAVFALPATASALVPLHLNPTPAKGDVIGVGKATLSTGGFAVTCNTVNGTATFEAGGTTGSVELTFGADCTGPFGSTCTGTNPVEPAGNIKTTPLPFHLVTLPGNSPGVLITPAADGTFAHFTCHVLGIPVQTTVEGNGVIGTITSPACNGSSSSATLSFKAKSAGVQEHTKVAGTETVYTLKKGEETAAQEGHATLTLTNSSGAHVSSQLVCT